MGARSRAGWVVLAAVGLITIVALTSRSGLGVPAVGLPDRDSLVTVTEIVGYVALGVGLAVAPFAAWLYWMRWRKRRRELREDALPVMSLWMRMLVGAALLAFVVGQGIVTLSFFDELQRAGIRIVFPSGLGESLTPGAPEHGGRSQAALTVAAVVLIGIALLAVAVAIRWRLLDRPTGVSAVDRRVATQEAVDVSLEALRNEPDPRRAVIAAYAAMEQSLAKAGFGRAPHEAPLEYVRRVLDVSAVADDQLRMITQLFQHARFSDHPVPESMRTQAIDALDGIRATIWQRT